MAHGYLPNKSLQYLASLTNATKSALIGARVLGDSPSHIQVESFHKLEEGPSVIAQSDPTNWPPQPNWGGGQVLPAYKLGRSFVQRA